MPPSTAIDLATDRSIRTATFNIPSYVAAAISNHWT